MPLDAPNNSGDNLTTTFRHIEAYLYEIAVNGSGSGDSLPSQTGHAGEYLTTDGTTASWGALAGGGDVVASGVLALNAIALGGGGTTVKTTTTGTGVVTALGVNTGSAGAMVLFNGAGGTPSSLDLTNATMLPLTTGVTGVLGETNGGTGQSQLIDLDAANLGSGVATNQFALTADGAGGCAWLSVALAGAVTASKITMTSARLLGRTTAATGSIEEITVGSGLSLSGGTLSATGSGTPAGSNTEVQFNNSGAFGASANFNFITASSTLRLGASASVAGGLTIFGDGSSVGGTLTLQGTGAASTSISSAAASGRIVQFPDASGTVVLNASTVTLTNKTISGANNTITNVAISTAVSGLGANVATFLATPSSANLASALTDETGSGAVVFATSPTLVTPILGTPTSGTLTNCTIPASGITAGTLTANVTLGEGAGQLILDATLSVDGTYSGICDDGTAGATLAFGDVCYFNVTDSRWELADASAASTSGLVQLGICVLAAAADADPTRMLLFGKIRADTAFPTLTVGAPVYVSETAGDLTGTQPTTTDAVIRTLGFAITADSIWWNPSGDFLTHV